MFGIENYWGFIVAGIVLAVTPGTDTIYILSRTLAQGKGAGIASTLGVSSGVLIWGLLVSFGLATVLTQLPSVLLFIKIIGAVYILWIAIQMWRHNDLDVQHLQADMGHMAVGKIYKQGIVTNLLNPKVGLFFMALLPQFVSTQAHSALPFLLLTVTFIVIGTLWCLFLVVLAGLISHKLQQNPHMAQTISRISAVVLGAMGVHIAYTSLKDWA